MARFHKAASCTYTTESEIESSAVQNVEVKTNEIPFLLEDGQTIARIKYEKLNKNSNIVYGKDIKSNYQNQGLKLSKHFK